MWTLRQLCCFSFCEMQYIASVIRVSFGHSLNVCGGIATGNTFCGIGEWQFQKR